MRRRLIAVVLALAAVVVAAVASTASARSSETRLSLVGYAVPREALGAVIKAWQQTSDGKDVSFTQSYGASGPQSLLSPSVSAICAHEKAAMLPSLWTA